VLSAEFDETFTANPAGWMDSTTVLALEPIFPLENLLAQQPCNKRLGVVGLKTKENKAFRLAVLTCCIVDYDFVLRAASST
jgi:hypothetical protein